jgi:hypothetical protein
MGPSSHALIVHPLFIHSLDEPPVTVAPCWTNLPQECLLTIASFLCEKDLCQLSQCSRDLHNLANDETVWEKLVKAKFSPPNHPGPPSSWKELYKFNFMIFKRVFAGEDDNRKSSMRDSWSRLQRGANNGPIRLSVAGSS